MKLASIYSIFLIDWRAIVEAILIPVGFRSKKIFSRKTLAKLTSKMLHMQLRKSVVNSGQSFLPLNPGYKD
jgi:hypothetical protein